jgi:activator of 2-hydroxyglutaryl-CoA dehydratase
MFNLRLGIDIGSTTAKAVILNGSGDLLFSSYRRHNAETVQTLQETLAAAWEKLGDVQVAVLITGSARGSAFHFFRKSSRLRKS